MRWYWIFGLLLLVCAPLSALAQLNVRVSVKFILGSSGQRPSNGGGFGASGVDLVNNASVISNINYSNDLMRRNGRGYQYTLTEIQDVSGWSGFFNLAARDQDNKEALQAVATSNATTRAQFFWRDNAVNVYINNTSSGYCSSVGNGEAIFVGSRAYDTLIIHEVGHFFDLAHTHSGEQFRDSDNSSCAAADCTCAILLGGNTDGITDTIADHECWSRAQIAAGTPGASQTQIDNVWLNIMSYHLPQDRFTSGQLDVWTDTANSARNAMVTGRTRFVDRDNVSGFQFGTSVFPYPTVGTGVANAIAGDIVLIRPGNYNQPQTINKAVTLRATRGNAVIGIP